LRKFRQIPPNGILRGRNGVRCGRADADFPRFSERRGFPPKEEPEVTIPRAPHLFPHTVARSLTMYLYTSPDAVF
jgi:hypothetical protein